MTRQNMKKYMMQHHHQNNKPAKNSPTKSNKPNKFFHYETYRKKNCILGLQPSETKKTACTATKSS